jgi:hypothetical protein
MRIYLIVMAPICALQLFLLVNDSPVWIRWSAGAVVTLSIVGFLRGYLRRLVIDQIGATWITPVGRNQIPWQRVKRVAIYLPGGGLGATRYVYISTQDAEPPGRWVQDSETIQLQERDGLLGAIEAARALSTSPIN